MIFHVTERLPGQEKRGLCVQLKCFLPGFNFQLEKIHGPKHGPGVVDKNIYTFKFFDKAGEEVCSYDLYGYTIYRNSVKTVNESMASSGINTPFYLRGFEFSQQMVRLLNKKGDVLSPRQIGGIERALKLIEDAS